MYMEKRERNFHNSGSLNIVGKEKCLLWKGEVQNSRMPFWEERGLSLPVVWMLWWEQQPFILSLGLWGYLKLYSRITYRRYPARHTQAFIIKPAHICHPTIHFPLQKDHLPKTASPSIPGCLDFTVCCRETMTFVLVMSYEHRLLMIYCFTV